jgi:alpha-glucosidase
VVLAGRDRRASFCARECAYVIFLDNTFRGNFDIGHQTEGVLSFGAEEGALDYYFICGPEPKKVQNAGRQRTRSASFPFSTDPTS